VHLVGMLPVYNEVDIVEEVIQHLLSQGLDLVVLDNGSTDGSYEICTKFAEKGLITLNQVKTSKFDFPLILRILYDMALTRNPDWLIRSDQDEILESGNENLTLKEAIEREDEKGCNLIQFDVFEFFMTNNDNLSAKSIKDKFRYYSWQHDNAYRAWKHIPGTRVGDAGGHFPIFPEGIRHIIAEKKMVLRHYRFRDKEQAIKNNKERIARVKDIPERKIGWYEHLDKISEQKYFEPVNYRLLCEYKEDNKWNSESGFQPFVLTTQPKREELFSEDGRLLLHYPSVLETLANLKENDEKINQLQNELKKFQDFEFDKIEKAKFVDDNGGIDLNKKPFILITGMHRSGTSFLARALNLAGVYLGDLGSFVSHDWLPHGGNLRGNWENTEFLQLGEKTLEYSNGSWESVPDRITINEDIGKEINESVKKLISHPSLMTGFKDPRVLLCLQAWKPFLPENIFIFGTFRHPLKVAESLKIRNNLSYQHSLGLWKIYNQKLLEFLEKYNGFLVNFDWPKEKMLSELNSIFNKLGLSNTINLSEWYTGELIRSDKTYESTYEIPDDINQIYSKLLVRSQSNDQINVKTPHHTVDELKEIINGLLSELQTQGIYFKKIKKQ